MPEELTLKGKVVFVSGGSRGIGRSIVLGAAERGAQVAFSYRTDEGAALETQKTANGRAYAFRCDVRESESLERLAEEIQERFGGIDVVVHNAGITADAPVTGMEDEEWDRVIQTNLTGAFRVVRAFGRYLVGRRSGCIVLMSSAVASTGSRGQANYAASKGGIEALTRALAVELAPKGITVNAVAPGVVETDMTDAIRRSHGERLRERIPLGRFASPGEVAELVCFLASGSATYITGQVVHIDGGWGLWK